jgi:C1A family cysteine protease
MARFIPQGFGWHRDLPDPRDYTPAHELARPLLAGLKPERSARGGAPRAVGWKEFFSPVDCQLGLAASSAHACAALVGYFERRASGKSVEGSRLFLHQAARLQQRGSGDGGVSLRQACKALVRFGLPPEEYWPYRVDALDKSPGPFLFSYARDYAPLLYVRLDRAAAGGAPTLARLRSFLAAGFAAAFGFTVFDSLSRDPLIPFPTCYDSARGGQAAVALGYDDGLRIRSEKGALLVRSSWGAEWGEEGFGWLPYRYVEEELAVDFWTLLRPDWLGSGEFKHPA